jgi:predicted rRNA methylase YqxC with S4 and FtsJ domains
LKIRLDQYLVQHGLIQSRERAKAMIMSGVVFVNEQKVDKAGKRMPRWRCAAMISVMSAAAA